MATVFTVYVPFDALIGEEESQNYSFQHKNLISERFGEYQETGCDSSAATYTLGFNTDMDDDAIVSEVSATVGGCSVSIEYIQDRY
ncbi:hypothetical protein [Photobacterium damselae]|uniref:hypothetical protein n=1 Tax=Photobacterium damselae TaxID=38293 RepID=UPI0040678F4A